MMSVVEISPVMPCYYFVLYSAKWTWLVVDSNELVSHLVLPFFPVLNSTPLLRVSGDSGEAEDGEQDGFLNDRAN